MAKGLIQNLRVLLEFADREEINWPLVRQAKKRLRALIMYRGHTAPDRFLEDDPDYDGYYFPGKMQVKTVSRTPFNGCSDKMG